MNREKEIVVLVPCMDLMLLVKEIQEETDLCFTAQFGLYDAAITQARQAVEEGANVLISRGETASLIRREIRDIPVLEIPFLEVGTLEMLIKAQDYGGPIAILGFGPVLRTVERILPYVKLRVPYEIFPLTNVAEAEGTVHEIIRRGFKVAVGNPYAVKLGITLGLPGFFSTSTREEVLAVLKEAATINRLINDSRSLKGRRALEAPPRSRAGGQRGFVASARFEDVLHESRVMDAFLRQATLIAELDEPVLITGETGTGKNLMAQCIHNASRRKDGPFLWLNCAALPEQLVESELFGYQGGAFSGASKGGKQGLFDMAMGGTLLLDEVGELPLSIQSKLLQVLDEHRFFRVGGDSLIRADLRIIAATNRPIAGGAESGLRRDLFHRLSVFHLHIPPLRERPEDVPLLLNRFLAEARERYGRPETALPRSLLDAMARYPFPGNVRELRNMALRLVGSDCQEATRLLAQLSAGAAAKEAGTEARPAPDRSEAVTLKPDSGLSRTGPSGRHPDGGQGLRELEWQHIVKTLAQCGGNKARAARMLGISTTTLWRRCKRAMREGIH